jgi:glutamate/tyrosine decarboxylase-like PLP-dependent enzyme
MDRRKYDELVSTFFEWQQPAITQIFGELLAAAAAESAMTPSAIMSQNYETARANPEIHNLPGNLKDARDVIFPYFWGTDSWNNPLHLENVRGPANNASLIGMLACLLKNPNLCTDRYSQRSNELEVKAITTLANLIFYHTDDPWGVFTIGGTISNLYGAKIGLERVLPGAMRTGLGAERIVGICSQASHYSNQTVAGWLGIGTENLIEIPTDENLAMRIDLLSEQLDALYQSRTKVAYICCTFGTTDGFGFDDIEAVHDLIHRKAAEHGMVVPQLHVDAAVGWALSMLSDYDVESNDLLFDPEILGLVGSIQAKNKGLRFADSVTIDFHKMGRGHYPASAFIVNRREDLKYLARTVSDTPYFSDANASRDPALFTLECSRPALGPYSVIASLNGIGLTGWQMLLARSLELAHRLKTKLAKLEYCKVLNAGTPGASVNWWVFPKGRNAEAIYQQLVRNELSLEQRQRYLPEVRRLFDKRTKMMDPALDARLGFTTSFGYCPNGIDIPAWKAVFFNPKTTEAMVDRIVESIEEL